MSKKQAAEELAEQKKKYYEQKGIGEKSLQGFLTYSEHRYWGST